MTCSEQLRRWNEQKQVKKYKKEIPILKKEIT
jgi:hypothetical protein